MAHINAKVGVSKGTRDLNPGPRHHLHPYLLYTSSEGYREAAHLRRLALTFVARQCDNDQHIMCWVKYPASIRTILVKKSEKCTLNLGQKVSLKNVPLSSLIRVHFELLEHVHHLDADVVLATILSSNSRNVISATSKYEGHSISNQPTYIRSKWIAFFFYEINL